MTFIQTFTDHIGKCHDLRTLFASACPACRVYCADPKTSRDLPVPEGLEITREDGREFVRVRVQAKLVVPADMGELKMVCLKEGGSGD